MYCTCQLDRHTCADLVEYGWCPVCSAEASGRTRPSAGSRWIGDHKRTLTLMLRVPSTESRTGVMVHTQCTAWTPPCCKAWNSVSPASGAASSGITFGSVRGLATTGKLVRSSQQDNPQRYTILGVDALSRSRVRLLAAKPCAAHQQKHNPENSCNGSSISIASWVVSRLFKRKQEPHFSSMPGKEAQESVDRTSAPAQTLNPVPGLRPPALPVWRAPPCQDCSLGLSSQPGSAHCRRSRQSPQPPASL